MGRLLAIGWQQQPWEKRRKKREEGEKVPEPFCFFSFFFTFFDFLIPIFFIILSTNNYN